MKLVKPKNEFTDKYGDVWVNEKTLPFLGAFDVSEFDSLLSWHFVSDLYENALAKLQIDGLQTIVTDNVDECPYTKQNYYCLLPYALLSNDLTSYREYVKGNWQWQDIFINAAKDAMKQFQEEPSAPDGYFGLGDIETLLLGSGYDVGRINSDGSREWKWCTLRLDNGDAILCAVLVWFNK
jgi:hypothetical protein